MTTTIIPLIIFAALLVYAIIKVSQAKIFKIKDYFTWLIYGEGGTYLFIFLFLQVVAAGMIVTTYKSDMLFLLGLDLCLSVFLFIGTIHVFKNRK